ncbi:MAG TPA: hypothetical protein VKH65_01490, partial [Myxococcales bacterium]|nr:hypothetical protein [Myxococcales bacterium]
LVTSAGQTRPSRPMAGTSRSAGNPEIFVMDATAGTPAISRIGPLHVAEVVAGREVDLVRSRPGTELRDRAGARAVKACGVESG